MNADIADGQTIPMTFDTEFIIRQKVPQKLAFLGIHYINELDDLLQKNRERIVRFGRYWLTMRRPTGINYYSIVHYALACLAMEGQELPDASQLGMLMDSIYTLSDRK